MHNSVYRSDMRASQQRVFEAYQAFYSKNGYPPAVRELCTIVDLNSTSTVSHHLHALRDMGLIPAHHRRNLHRVIAPLVAEIEKLKLENEVLRRLQS